MTLLTLDSIKQIPSALPHVYAFDITGHVSADDADAIAKYMNDAFDRHDKVAMLMRLNDFTGSDKTAIFDADVIESRLRSLTNVSRYAVVGAPDAAETMIAVMDKVIPVDARAFAAEDEQAAWNFVNATAV